MPSSDGLDELGAEAAAHWTLGDQRSQDGVGAGKGLRGEVGGERGLVGPRVHDRHGAVVLT